MEIQHIVMAPQNIRTLEGLVAYLLIMGGLGWLFVVSNHSERFQNKDLFLSEDGVLSIFITSEAQTSFYRNTLIKAAKLIGNK